MDDLAPAYDTGSPVYPCARILKTGSRLRTVLVGASQCLWLVTLDDACGSSSGLGPSDRLDTGSRRNDLTVVSAPGWVRYIVSAASDPTVARRAGADRLCGRNRRFIDDVSIINNCSSDLMPHPVEMSVKHGPVTLLSAVQTAESPLKLLMAEAESVPGPILQIGNTNSRYRFSVGVRRFVNEWNAPGPAYHCAVGLGHIAGKIEKLGFLLGIETVRVC